MTKNEQACMMMYVGVYVHVFVQLFRTTLGVRFKYKLYLRVGSCQDGQT